VAGFELEAPPRSAAHDAVSAAIVLRADEPHRPSSAMERVDASGLCAEAMNELGQRHAMLKLDEVVGHDAGSRVREAFSLCV